MLDLSFQVEGAEPERFAAEPLLLIKLRITETGSPATPIHAVALRCQVRIEPARRRYSAKEQERLVELFGAPERWGQTLRPMLWTNISTVIPSFTGSTSVDVPVPCSSDFSLAATKYFDALPGGDLPLCFLFSGTIFHKADDGSLQIAQISWEKEATYRLPATTWRGLMEAYYPNCAWLMLRRDVFDALAGYKRRQGLITWEQAVERLLAAAEEPATP